MEWPLEAVVEVVLCDSRVRCGSLPRTTDFGSLVQLEVVLRFIQAGLAKAGAGWSPSVGAAGGGNLW